MENENSLVFNKSEPTSSGSFNSDDITIEGEGYFVSTGDLASQLKISRDMVRNYIKEFEDYFDLSYTKEGKGGHIRFPSNQTDLLGTIIRLRKTKSVDEVKEILDNPDMPFLFQNGERVEKQLGVLLAENNKYLAALLEKVFTSALEEKMSNLIGTKDADLESKQKALDEVLQLNEQLMQQNAELRDSMKESSIQLKEMHESNLRLESQMENLLERFPDPQSQKRGLFSFFKK